MRGSHLRSDSPMAPPSAQERYLELAARVDALFERVIGRYAGAMQCGPGCTDCCAGGLTVALVEASVIAESLAAMPAPARRAAAEGASAADAGHCAALDGEQRCRIYAARPLVCRSHGLPIRTVADASAGEASAQLEVCPLNFRDLGLAAVDEDSVLDQTTLSTVVGALDMAFADEQGCPRGERLALAELLAEPNRYFEMPDDSAIAEE